jgi:hypothetical protein
MDKLKDYFRFLTWGALVLGTIVSFIAYKFIGGRWYIRWTTTVAAFLGAILFYGFLPNSWKTVPVVNAPVFGADAIP